VELETLHRTGGCRDEGTNSEYGEVASKDTYTNGGASNGAEIKAPVEHREGSSSLVKEEHVNEDSRT
jgi:hypothetical protein